MAILHDVYTFDFGKYEAILASIGSDYEQLHEKALKLFTEDAKVQYLADLYGGWGIDTILNLPDSPENINFYLLLILYHCIEHVPGLSISFGDQWRGIYELLRQLGWNEFEARNLVFGKKLYQSLETTLNKETLDMLRPESTSSTIGWLNAQDKLEFLGKLERTSQGYTLPEMQFQIQLVKDFLQFEINDQSSICIITSG